MTLTGRQFLDGPRFVEWLEGEGVGGGDSRAFRRWKDGGAASVHSADRFLTKVGLHLGFLPDDLWIETFDTPAYKNAKKARADRARKSEREVR